MKRFILSALSSVIILCGCSTRQYTDIKSAEKIEIVSGIDGTSCDITDKENISYIMENINSADYDKKESSGSYTGWSYTLNFYDSDGNISDKIVILSESRIDYDGYIYEIKDNTGIDISFIESLMENVNTSSNDDKKMAVNIDYADEEMLKIIGSYYEFDADDSEYATKAIFTSETSVTDLRLLSVEMDDMDEDGNISFHTNKVLYTVDELTSDKPLVVNLLISETIPNMGITYTDENGIEKYYTISMSGFDGSLLLIESDIRL